MGQDSNTITLEVTTYTCDGCSDTAVSDFDEVADQVQREIRSIGNYGDRTINVEGGLPESWVTMSVTVEVMDENDSNVNPGTHEGTFCSGCCAADYFREQFGI
jgi:hypothetical protein